MQEIEYGPLLRQLRSTQGKLEVALGAIDEAIVWTDHQGLIQWCNGAFDRLVQRPHFRNLGEPLQQLLPLEHAGAGSGGGGHPWKQAAEGGVIRGLYRFSQGESIRALEVSASRVEVDRQASIVMTMRDVTEETRTRERIRRLMRQNQLILDSAGEGVYGLDPEGRTTFVNPAAARMLGWAVEELIGQPQHQVIHHSRADGSAYPAEQCPIYAAIREGVARTVRDEVFWRKDGSCFAVEYTSTPIVEEGEIQGAVVVFRDSTERRLAEADTARRSRLLMLLQRITEAANEAESVEQVMRFALDRICAHTGWPLGHVYLTDPESSSRQLVPTRIWNSGADSRYDDFRSLTEVTEFKVGRGLPGRVTSTRQPYLLADLSQDPDFARADGARRAGLVSAFAFPVTVGSGVTAVMEFFSTARAEPDVFLLEIMGQVGRQLGEVIQRKRAETRLHQSNRDLEVFASVASHDLQEPLRKITAFGDRLEEVSGEALDDRGRLYLSRMTAAAGRMQVLIDDLLQYARVSSRGRPLERLDLDQLIRQVLSDLETRIEESGARVELEPLPRVEADPSQMGQLFQNLIANALKFRHPERTPEVRISGRMVSDSTRPWCEITVADNGIGFDQQYGERIFEVFGRLHGRTAYPGTGMGLAICRKIVERHGGTIEARGESGEGARFLIRLPARRDPAKEVEE